MMRPTTFPRPLAFIGLILMSLMLAIPTTAQESETDPDPDSLEVKLSTVQADPTTYDGTEITLIGELVGDYSPRSFGVWVQLNDDPYVQEPLLERSELAGTNIGIGVLIPSDLFPADELGRVGGYVNQGPIVAITGTFRFHDPEQGGETYLDASEVVVIEASRELSETLRFDLAITGGVMVVVAAMLLAFGRFRDRS